VWLPLVILINWELRFSTCMWCISAFPLGTLTRGELLVWTSSATDHPARRFEVLSSDILIRNKYLKHSEECSDTYSVVFLLHSCFMGIFGLMVATSVKCH
jgi:hypothetical protein